MGILLLVFMGNMVFNQILNGTYNEKVAIALTHTDLVNQAASLQEEEKLKKEFIEKLGLEVNPQFAVFSDEIGETVPQSIQLNRLIVNPLKKAIRKNKLIEFKKEIIDRKRIKLILGNVRKKSIKKGIDTKISNKIWKSMIYAFIDYEFRNFKKKRK